MKFGIALVLLAGMAAPDLHALEAVAMPSDGAGSGSGASVYALTNQVTTLGAAVGAQGTVLQQVNQAVTSLTTLVNNMNTQLTNLTQYVANTTCAGGTLTTTNNTMTCAGGTNGTNGTNGTTAAAPDPYAGGCSSSPGGQIPSKGPPYRNGEVVSFAENCWADGLEQCSNGQWTLLHHATNSCW
ncbi:MAG: hypothetical protein GC129_03650 [Proteobacteria bacterium]|nr:hypothetical protein [Pseudomonadota bacterium]